jgi:pimeloyl-ACP methyl ester carboxylesterase
MINNRVSEAFGPWCDVWIRSGWRVQIHCVTGQARTLNAQGVSVAFGLLEECTVVAARSAPSADAKRAAVLLHGLWNYPGIMTRLAGTLQARGWAVANVGYPSMRLSLAAHGSAASHAARALAEDGAHEVSFVGHSLGGLVARAAMANAKRDGWRPGRLVLIGSPIRGSTVAEQFQHVPGYRTIVGGCSDVVTPTGATTISSPICRDILVIAGGTGGLGYNPLIPGDNDGLIAVEETRMQDRETKFLLLRSAHKFLPTRPETISACSQFLDADM